MQHVTCITSGEKNKKQKNKNTAVEAISQSVNLIPTLLFIISFYSWAVCETPHYWKALEFSPNMRSPLTTAQTVDGSQTRAK